jgi:multidrug resistance efflux pump
MHSPFRKEVFGSTKPDSSHQQEPGSNTDSSSRQERKATPDLDAVQLQARLADSVQAWDDGAPAPEPEVVTIPDQPSDRRGLIIRRSVKTLIALAVAAALGWTPLQRLLQNTSAEAAVNARLITLRAPIDGEIKVPQQLVEAGTSVQAGEEILRVTNPRADRSHLDDLRRTISGLQSESGALEQREQQLEKLRDDLRNQRDAFQQGRIQELQARIDEITAEIASAEAQRVDAASTLDRTQKLRITGNQSEAALIHADRDHKVAVSTGEALRQRLIGTKVELDAARRGLFVGDSYNDIPRTAQRVDEVTQLIIDLGGQLEERKMRISQLQSELLDEEKRFADLSSANVVAPVPGRVWEVLTANGEEVRRGQDLVRVLDCGGVVVTAAVSEAVYNELRLGQAATFHLRGESEEREGRIVGLNGLAAVPANLAIEQNALAREPYHVTVQIPSLSARSDCYVGRTGKVTFDTSTSSGATRSAADGR